MTHRPIGAKCRARSCTKQADASFMSGENALFEELLKRAIEQVG